MSFAIATDLYPASEGCSIPKFLRMLLVRRSVHTVIAIVDRDQLKIVDGVRMRVTFQQKLQVPSQWLKSPDAESATELAMKKILYRALISPLLTFSAGGSSDAEQMPKRLGKLNVKMHDTFRNYLMKAGQKRGIDLMASYKEKVSQRIQ